MAVDLTGGLTDDREFVFAAQPDDPEMRESVNAWIWDRGTDVGMPRIGVEAVADQWDTHDIQLNIALPPTDGCSTRSQPGKAHDPIGGDGKPRGPRRRAAVVRAGRAVPALADAARRARVRERPTPIRSRASCPTASPTVPVEIEIDLVGAVPPWENGAMLARGEAGARRAGRGRADGRAALRAAVARDGHRPGRRRRARDRRRRVCGSAGRASAGSARSAATPGSRRCSRAGAAFGYIVYPPRDDGHPTYNEGYLFEGDGELIPRGSSTRPWLRDAATERRGRVGRARDRATARRASRPSR